MGFVLPAALGLLGLSLPILLLYLLRLRREERTVSSTYLWAQALRDIEANAPWQRLRRNLLLILQLAALAAIVLALAGPYLPSARVQQRDLILVVDTSASMAATDVRPNRLAAARSEARQLVARLSPEGRVTLIDAGPPPRVLVAHSADRDRIEDALDLLQASAGHSDLTAALQLAAALAAETNQVEVILLSDGAVTLGGEVVLPAAFRFLPIGQSGYNQGIVACSLEPSGDRLSLFLRVENYVAQPVERRLDLIVDGVLLTARHLELPARGALALTIDLPRTIEAVEARLEAAGGQGDDLPTDDVAWAVPPPSGLVRILLVTEGNRFLQTALGLLPGAEVTLIPPDGFAGWRAANEENLRPDLFLFDACLPEQLPAGNLFFVGPPASTPLFEIQGVLESPRLRPAEQDDPLLHYVDVGSVQLRQAQAIALPSWARPVLVDRSAEGRPLLFTGEVEGRRVAVLAFDLHDSDLPLQAAFPLLLANLVDSLAPTTPAGLPAALLLGEPMVIEAPPQVQQIVVRAPRGDETQLQPTGGPLLYEATDAPGLYEVRWRGEGQEWERALVPVALLSSEEGAITPREQLPDVSAAAAGPTGELPAGRLSLRTGLAGAGLVLLCVEWAVAHRGGFTALRLRRSPRAKPDRQKRGGEKGGRSWA